MVQCGTRAPPLLRQEADPASVLQLPSGPSGRSEEETWVVRREGGPAEVRGGRRCLANEAGGRVLMEEAPTAALHGAEEGACGGSRAGADGSGPECLPEPGRPLALSATVLRTRAAGNERGLVRAAGSLTATRRVGLRPNSCALCPCP